MTHRNGVNIEKYLLVSGFEKKTCTAFRKLIDFVEWKEPISNSLLKKFENCGIYFPDEKKICGFENNMDLILNAMIFEGMLQKKIDCVVYPKKPMIRDNYKSGQIINNSEKSQ